MKCYLISAIGLVAFATSATAQPRSVPRPTTQSRAPKSSAPIVMQSSGGYPQTETYVRNPYETIYRAMIGAIEWSSFPAWEPLPRERLQRIANQQRKTVDVYRGFEKIETFFPK